MASANAFRRHWILSSIPFWVAALTHLVFGLTMVFIGEWGHSRRLIINDRRWYVLKVCKKSEQNILWQNHQSKRFSTIFLVAGLTFFIFSFVSSGLVPWLMMNKVPTKSLDDLAKDIPASFYKLAADYPGEFKQYYGEANAASFKEAVSLGRDCYIRRCLLALSFAANPSDIERAAALG